MTKAFTNQREKRSFMGVILPLAFFCMVLVFVVFGIGVIADTTAEEQCAVVENAILRSAVQCYALEGVYPEDISYLANHYSVLLDTEKYVYHYRFLGNNIMPQISVFNLQ